MQKTESTGRWFLSTLRPFRLPIVQLIVVGVLLAIVSAVLPLILQRIIDASMSGEAAKTLLYLYIPLSYLSAAPITFVLRERLVDRYIQQRRQQAFEQSLRQDVAFYETRDSMVVTTQLAKGLGSSSRLLIILSNSDLLIDIPLAIFAAVYIGSYSLLALGLLLGFLGVFVVVARMSGPRLAKTEREYQTLDTALGSRQRESIHHVAIVRSHNASGLITRKTGLDSLRLLQLQNRSTWLYSMFHLLSQGGHRVAESIILVTFLAHLGDGTLSVGTFVALSAYAGFIVSPADFIGTSYATLKQAWANIVPYHDLMRVRPMVIESEHPLSLQPVRGGIEFRGVSFAYQNGKGEVLRDFDLVIPAGKTTAIVGKTGAGKTTMARLITRLYDPTTGMVLCDGMDIRHMSFASLSAQIAYLSQDVPIFSGTIAENVAFGHNDYTADAVVAALKKAAADFVFTLPEGIDTEIGEGGKRLSGGEKQRIAIARMFMGNPSVLVLDEATAALDPQTEREVTAAFDTLSEVTTGLTKVVIAHRLTTIEHADQIVVLDAGGIAAIGTHPQLLANCPTYQAFTGKLAT